VLALAEDGAVEPVDRVFAIRTASSSST
jgi:hypothetical protein